MPSYPVKPIGKHFLVKMLTVVRRSNIFLPQENSINIFLGLILDCGNEINDKIIVPNRLAYFDSNFCRGKYKRNNISYYFFREESVILVKDNSGVFRPFGNRALVWRDTEEEQLASGIWIPACYQTKDQTKIAYYYRAGINNGEIVDFPCTPGDKIELRKWDTSLHEIEVDGKYMLSVPTNMIVYKKEEIQ
jgi:co-chaperonin GroES (HSP10)